MYLTPSKRNWSDLHIYFELDIQTYLKLWKLFLLHFLPLTRRDHVTLCLEPWKFSHEKEPANSFEPPILTTLLKKYRNGNQRTPKTIKQKPQLH